MLDVRSSRNVQVHPRDFVGHERTQKPSSLYSARVGRLVRVVNVGNVALNQILVLAPHGKFPNPLPALMRRTLDFLRKLRVVSHQASCMRAQRYYARASKRSQVDYAFGLECSRMIQSIAQNHPSFSVGVRDFNSLSAGSFDEIARLVRTA